MNKNTFRRSTQGFTLVETLVALLCGIIVITGAMLTLTVSTKFANLEKAETIAQNIARNIMSQKVSNNKFDDLKSLMSGNTQKSISLYDFKDLSNINLGSSVTLLNDLKTLKNSQCNLILTNIDSGKKINSKVEVVWDLSNEGTIIDKTRKVELSSIISEFNFMNTQEKRTALSSKVLLTALTAPNCDSTNSRIQGCKCSYNSQCLSSSCITNTNTQTNVATPKVCQ